MLELGFKTPTGEVVYYNTGQGMGIYSSWTSIALLHHVLVRLAALRCGIHPFSDYIILGDDVAIANGKVAEAYKDIMTGLGVEISHSKRVVPQENFNSVEFASKLIVNGVNIRPLPLGLLFQDDVVRFLRLSQSTLVQLAECSVTDPLSRLLEAMAQGPSSFRRAPSNPFNDGILGRIIFKNLSLEDYVTILGISTAVSLFKENFGSCNIEPFDMRQVTKPLPRLGRDFVTYLEIVPWHQPSRLLKVMQDLTNSLFRQATAKVYQYAFDHNELANRIIGTLGLSPVEKTFLSVGRFPEF